MTRILSFTLRLTVLTLLTACLYVLACAPAAQASVAERPWPPASGPGQLFVHFGEEHYNDDDGSTLFPKVVELLEEQGGGDIIVFGGGIIPGPDVPKLKQAGIQEVFTPGAPTKTIVEWVRQHVAQEV